MSHKTFKKIYIVYNPNSTGDSVKNAKALKNDLLKSKFKVPIELIQTKHAGHAEEIALSLAKSKDPILLISSSGDGGYHELINGVLHNKSHHITVGVLPSGNANDHYNALELNPIVDNILQGQTRLIDTIEVKSTIKGTEWRRFAHSYVGIGLTPTIGKELTKAKLNFFNEKWLVLKHLFVYDHVSVNVDGKKKRVASMVFGNIDRMSKVIQLADKSSVSDGKFELQIISHDSKLSLIKELFRSSTIGREEDASLASYEFETIKPLKIQLDGEIYTIDSHSKVLIQSVNKSLTTIL